MPLRKSGLADPPLRCGISVAELVVVMAIFGLFGTAVGMTLLRQQRFYRGASELLRAREGVRDAMEVMSSDIRGMAAADTIRLHADSAIEFFANIGSSVVCKVTADGTIGLAPTSAGGNTLSAFLTDPDTGDLAVIYQNVGDKGNRWERHRISAFTSRAVEDACPPNSPFARPVPATARAYALNLTTPVGDEIGPGTPVRFIRRGRYSLYRSSDGEWYLGYRRCNANGPSLCGPVQPLSGPYTSYTQTGGSTSGLLFEYFDALGAKLDASAPALMVARVDITARSESRQRMMVEGKARSFGDSATVSVGIRNRWH